MILQSSSSQPLAMHVANFFVPKLQHFLSVLNVTQGKTNDKFIVNNFYPVISYRRVQQERKARNYRVRSWSLVTVRNQLPAQGVKTS